MGLVFVVCWLPLLGVVVASRTRHTNVASAFGPNLGFVSLWLMFSITNCWVLPFASRMSGDTMLGLSFLLLLISGALISGYVVASAPSPSVPRPGGERRPRQD